jgi:hypothetical protein
MPKSWKELETTVEAKEEVARIKRDFSRLCMKHPQLIECQANFLILMEYFCGNSKGDDIALFDVGSGEFAIQNDPELAKRLAWRTQADVDKEKQDAVDAEKARLQNMTVSELRAAAKAEAKAFADAHKPASVVIPAELTQAAFLAANIEQGKKWLRQYGHKNLDAHWAQQAEEAKWA